MRINDVPKHSRDSAHVSYVG